MAVVQEFSFSSSDGVHQVHAMRWLPDLEPPKAVVQLVHGISEYINRYDAFARFLTEQGYAVVGHDHLGHGLTARGPEEFGYFADKDGWRFVLQDARALRLQAGAAFPSLPYFMMGHSMGSFVVRGYLMDYPATVDGAILSGTGQEPAPLVLAGSVLSALFTRTGGPKSHSTLLNSLSVEAYNKQFKPNRTSADWISRDEAMVDAYIADPLCQFLPTVSMFHDMMQGLRYLAKPENLRKMSPDTPVYFFSGDQDPVGGSGKWVRDVFEMFRQAEVKDATLKFYPGGRHEMLNEVNRAEVFQDTMQWLDHHVSQIKSPVGAGI